MTDDVDDSDESLDAATDARVREALAVNEPMPDEIWARLERALHAEAASQQPVAVVAAGVAQPIAAEPGASATVTPIRRRTPLLAGLVAAAAAIVAVAVIAPGLVNRSDDSAVVASEAMPVAAAAPADAAPADAALAEAAPADAVPAAKAAAPAASPLADTATPFAARQVMATGTDYTADTIDEAVTTLVDTVDASHTRLLSSVTQEPDPTAGSTGFTATPEGLAGCLQALTESTEEQALVVDRATFNGQDVGIVVVPAGPGASDPTMPFDQIDIWVVRPDCSAVQASIVWHDTLPVPVP